MLNNLYPNFYFAWIKEANFPPLVRIKLNEFFIQSYVKILKIAFQHYLRECAQALTLFPVVAIGLAQIEPVGEHVELFPLAELAVEAFERGRRSRSDHTLLIAIHAVLLGHGYVYAVRIRVVLAWALDGLAV